MRNVIPAINSLGYYSINECEFKSIDSADGLEEEWLDMYDILQYNNFDEKDRNRLVYGKYIDDDKLFELSAE